MQVTFGMTSGGVNGIAVINIDNKEYKFNKGVRNVTSKEEIELLMSTSLFERGELQLVTPPEVVARYLEGEDPDVLDTETLNSITEEGIRMLAKLYNTREKNLVALIKPQLRGKSVTDDAQEIIDKYAKPDQSTAEIKLESAIKDGTVIHAKPWYKTSDDSFKTKNKQEILKWVENNYGV
jgi:hypothetical protein